MRLNSPGRLLPFISAFALLGPLLFGASLALAQATTIGLTGSFYRQEYEAPQGSRLGGPSIFVSVSNQGDASVDVQMVFPPLHVPG